ncbi:acrosomal protein KIAA1210 homolog [Gastrophryne carolinensis]
MSALYSCLKGKNDTIMAANLPEGTISVEVEGTSEECSGKKKSKFQAFKKLFVKKKRKETPAPSKESNLKPSQSSSDVSVSGANEPVFHPAHESVPKSNLGSKAVSHDSIFISEMENSTKEDASQENTPGKVKALQLQLQQNIRIGSPPQGIVHKKLEDSGTLSEDDGLPRSPPEITSLHEILAQSSCTNFSTVQRRNSLSLGGTDSEDELESCESSSRPISPRNSDFHLSPTSQINRSFLVDFTTPPSSVACLDNSAAKHKIAIKPKKTRGLGMNVNRIKQEGEGAHIKESEKNDNKVASKHEASIPISEESSVENEAPDKPVPIMEGVVLQAETGTSLGVHEVDLPGEATMYIGTPMLPKTSLADKQNVELCTEEDESDVDFQRGSLAGEDLVNCSEEREIENQSTELAPISLPATTNEQDEIPVQSDPAEISNIITETVDLEVSEEQECDLHEDSLKTEKNILEFETNESLDIENKHQENNDQKFLNLSEQTCDLLDLSVFEANTTLTPQKEKLQPDSASFITEASEDVSNTASKPVTIYNCTDAVNTLDAEALPPMTDVPKMPDTPSNQNLQNLDIKTECHKGISLASSVKSLTSTIHLASRMHSSGDDSLPVKEASAETSKTIKPLQETVDVKCTASNKPVRFTVAPAWQRSFSVGSSAKESSFSNDKDAGAIRSESFDGPERPGMESCKESQHNEKFEASQDNSSVAFGVRLRRTSSSRKYGEEYPEEKNKHGLLSVGTMEVVSVQDVQVSAKTPPVRTDITKLSKPPHQSDDKPWQRKKSEDLSTQESSEPAWITMAKLKQKGFQEHPLARVHGFAMDGDKPEGTDDSLQKSNTVTSPQKLEVRRIETAPAHSPVLTEETQPDNGKNTKAAPPQNSEEPPWFSLAKKKAKAWSEMPPIVQ